jgi:hypothetical protein
LPGIRVSGFQSAEHFIGWCGAAILAVALDGSVYFRIPYGYMIVAVTLQMVHPAEYIELTFTQTMPSA